MVIYGFLRDCSSSLKKSALYFVRTFISISVLFQNNTMHRNTLSMFLRKISWLTTIDYQCFHDPSRDHVIIFFYFYRKTFARNMNFFHCVTYITAEVTFFFFFFSSKLVFIKFLRFLKYFINLIKYYLPVKVYAVKISINVSIFMEYEIYVASLLISNTTSTYLK